jgi:hypothetical protein
MAFFTERSAVVDCEAELGEVGEWFDVVGLYFASVFFAAPNALVIISLEN